MARKILVVSGSSRPGGVADTFVPVVSKELASRDNVEVTTVDVKHLGLPFFDAPVAPSSEEFAPDNENVLAWTKMVGDADAIVLVTPEYNGSLSAIQKNAIDWVFKEWNDKPVALAGYGWYGASRVHDNAKIVLGNVKANVLPTTTNLTFMKELNVDGTIADEAAVDAQLKATVDEVVAA